MTAGCRPWGHCRLNRRTFVQQSACALALLSMPTPLFPFVSQDVRQGFIKPYPALFYQVRANQKVRCQLCPRACEVKPGERGDCGVRENRKGAYYSLAYGNPCAVHVDPIEKKPFFHVLPGTSSYSIATAGCNLHCIFCQNWEISQVKPEETYNYDLPPEQVVARTREHKCPSIAYTYVEPIIFYEYMLDTAQLAKKAGILNVCHSAGYVSPEPLAKLAEVLDAACIDLKSFDDAFYREMVDGDLEPVLNTLKTLRQKGVHVEIVNLLIPQKNDRPETVKAMCDWIKKELGPLTPLHFSRFFPLHKMRNHYPTPVSTMEEARKIALQAGLKYVYLGNLPGNPAESTHCHHCGKQVIARRGYAIGEVNLKDGKCRHCGTNIPGIWRS